MVRGNPASERNFRPAPPPNDPLDEFDTELPTLAEQRLDPESNLVGKLMTRKASEVAEVLALVKDTDFERPVARAVVQIIRELVDDGREPDPCAIAAAARNPERIAAVSDNDLGILAGTSKHRFAAIAQYVVDSHTTGITVDLWGTVYQVVESAFRRSFGEHGLRICQMVECHADIDDLVQAGVTAVEEWRSLWSQLQAVKAHFATPVWVQPTEPEFDPAENLEAPLTPEDLEETATAQVTVAAAAAAAGNRIIPRPTHASAPAPAPRPSDGAEAAVLASDRRTTRQRAVLFADPMG